MNVVKSTINIILLHIVPAWKVVLNIKLRGDVALPKDVTVLVNDVVWLVNYLFKSGNAPECLNEGDCALPLDGNILVNDIVWLVNYLFKAGTPPPECWLQIYVKKAANNYWLLFCIRIIRIS